MALTLCVRDQYNGAGAAAQFADGTYFLVATNAYAGVTPIVLTDTSGSPATAPAVVHRVASGLHRTRNPQRRAVGDDPSVTPPVARIFDPAVPRLFVVKTVPLALDLGKTFDYSCRATT